MSALLEIVEDIGIRQQLFEVFSNVENGTPDNISKFGCLALAKKGAVVWNAWRKAFPVIEHELIVGDFTNFADFRDLEIQFSSFAGFDFGDGTNFTGTKFKKDIMFGRCTFGTSTTFNEASFSYSVQFAQTNFKDVSFNDTVFGYKHGVRFEIVEFEGQVSFYTAKFKTKLRFSKVKFQKSVVFYEALFPLITEFQQVDFYDLADFSWYEWNNSSSTTSNAKFEPSNEIIKILDSTAKNLLKVKFEGCIFEGECNFSNRNFKSTTIFGSYKDDANVKPTIFLIAPKFHNCELHQDTSFDGAEFPDATGNKESARAYRTLKLAFNKMQAVREEQLFFKLELAEEAKASSGLYKFLYHSYYALSNFGFSVSKPLWWCLFSIIFFFFSYSIALHFAHCNSGLDCHFRTNWLSFNTIVLKFSLINALPLPGIEKIVDLKDCNLYASSGPIGWVITGLIFIQKLFSLVLLFLIGLALKNLFKFK